MRKSERELRQERVESCIPMFKQFGKRVYLGMPQHFQNYIDAEDIAQDAVLLAIHSSDRYDPENRRKMKYSTFVYQLMTLRFRSVVTRARAKPAHVSLETPAAGFGIAPLVVSGQLRTLEQVLPAPELKPSHYEVVKSFITVCRKLSQAALKMMIHGFLLKDSKFTTAELGAEIGVAANAVHVGCNDLRGITTDVVLRNTIAVRLFREKLMSTTLQCLECVKCEEHFAIADAQVGKFFVSSMLCLRCLKRMVKLPAVLSCFGKQYAPTENVACRTHCPDRKACADFTRGAGASAISKRRM